MAKMRTSPVIAIKRFAYYCDVLRRNPSHIKHQECVLLCVQKCNESGIEEKFTKQAIKIIMELQIDI